MSDLQPPDVTPEYLKFSPYLPGQPLAVLCSDLHLRETAPSSRAEKDWYAVMEAQLASLAHAAEALEVPIICAGDVFDKWNPSASLVRFAMEFLPQMYAIPGQHDLRYHDYTQRYEGAYGCLVAANIIRDLYPNAWATISGGNQLSVWAMPWGRWEPPTTPAPMDTLGLGVLHKYAWCNEANKHPMADETSKIEKVYPNMDALLIGDNHVSWSLKNVLNHGGFIAQNSDQKQHIPKFGVLFATDEGAVIRTYPYNTPEPQWVETWQPQSSDQKIAGEVITELENLEQTGDSFMDRLKARVETVENPAVRSKLTTILHDLQNL